MEDSQLVTMNDDEDNMWVDDSIHEEEVPLKNRSKSSDVDLVLSQKLSQLSTSHHQSTDEHLTMMDNDGTHESIPYFLSRESKSFEQIINHIGLSTDTVEELRQMAILIYHIFTINLENKLWNTYLKAGTGKIGSNGEMNIDHNNNPIIGPQIWPRQVQQSMIKQSIHNTDYVTCLTYVNKHLSELDKKIKEYQSKLNVKRNQLSDHVQTIETFVQQGLESIRLKTEHQIALVQYNYNDHVLELEYLKHNPTQHQKQIMKQLNHVKYQEETTKEEYKLLEQRISIHLSSSQTSLLDLATHEKFFNQFNDDKHLQQKLHDQYANIGKQGKESMIELYLSSAKAQMDHYHKQFNNQLKQFWFEQHALPNHKKLTAVLIDLIDQRWKNMTESIKCVYKYKLDLLHLNSVHP